MAPPEKMHTAVILEKKTGDLQIREGLISAGHVGLKKKKARALRRAAE